MIKMKSRFETAKYCFFLSIIFLVVFLSSYNCYTSIGVLSEGSYKTIPVSEAKNLIDNTTDLFILDVRTPSEFKDGHISGAYLIPHTDIMDRQDELPANKTQPILVYCRSGIRSATASTTLVSLLYTQIYNMEKGFNEWKSAGYPYKTGPFIKPTTNTTIESSTDGQTTSSSTTPLISPAFELVLAIHAIGLLLIIYKKRL